MSYISHVGCCTAPSGIVVFIIPRSVCVCVCRFEGREKSIVEQSPWVCVCVCDATGFHSWSKSPLV